VRAIASPRDLQAPLFQKGMLQARMCQWTAGLGEK
jgi:hypothetical protein